MSSLDYNSTQYITHGSDYLYGGSFSSYAMIGRKSSRCWFDPNKQSQKNKPVLSGDELYIMSWAGSYVHCTMTHSYSNYDDLCLWSINDVNDQLYTVTGIRDGSVLAVGTPLEISDSLQFQVSGASTYLAQSSEYSGYLTSLADSPDTWGIYQSDDDVAMQGNKPKRAPVFVGGMR